MTIVHRSCLNRQKLDVAGLNEITVLVDRSETELTEVAINKWHSGLDGPPHAHPRKEQNFLVTTGRGKVLVGEQTFAAKPGAFFYLPAGVIHQTITEGEEPMAYFLFNAFLDSDKEGHASFAEHIELVKETRRQQAATQNASADPELGRLPPPPRAGLARDTAPLGPGSHPLLDRQQTERCEASFHVLPAGHTASWPADDNTELTLFAVKGSGVLEVAGESQLIEAQETVYLPRSSAWSFRAGSQGLRMAVFGTVVTR